MNRPSDRRALKRELATLIRRQAPIVQKDIIPLIGPLVDGIDAQHTHIHLPDADAAELKALIALHAQSDSNIIGGPKTHAPIVLWENKVYFRRYYNLERRIAIELLARDRALDASTHIADFAAVKDAFPFLSARQIEAIKLIHARHLSIITGGPGTGKTTLVKAVLTSLLQADPTLRVALAAPTGKAVARLENSLVGLSVPCEPIEVRTLHRLLGYGVDRGPHYHAHRRMAFDLVIIDEASMIDLNLADALLQALPDSARVVFIGDPNQLPSVNLGRLLADISLPIQTVEDADDNPAGSAAAGPSSEASSKVSNPLLKTAHCQLTENFRFQAQSGIDLLAQAIIERRQSRLPLTNSVNWIEPTVFDDEVIRRTFSPWIDCLKRAAAPEAFFNALDACRMLAPQYAGPNGVIALNQRVISILQHLNLLEPRRQDHFHGQPLLILKNDYTQGLFNGDVGFCLDPNQCSERPQNLPNQSGLVACFKHHREEALRYLPIDALPEHETCFAMTVHKAQGSEFNEVLFVLGEPNPDSDQHLLTQELLYTGVTRAKQQLSIVTTQLAWERAARHRFDRRSGLNAMLNALSEES